MLPYNLIHHLQKTSNLCVYRLQSEAIPSTLFFPKVTHLTLIHCSPTGVTNLLNPSIFPHLQKIHYLSLHPGQTDIHKRFGNKVKWIFPNQDYAFYQCMIDAGLGQVDTDLIPTYIYNKKIENQTIGFNLHVHGYDILDGELYRTQFLRYLLRIKNESQLIYLDDLVPNPYQDSHKEYYKNKLKDDFFKNMKESEEVSEEVFKEMKESEEKER